MRIKDKNIVITVSVSGIGKTLAYQSLIIPDLEVLAYLKYKVSDYDGWINSMQKLKDKFLAE